MEYEDDFNEFDILKNLLRLQSILFREKKQSHEINEPALFFRGFENTCMVFC